MVDSTRKYLQIEELVICSVCLRKYTDPRMLKCQHTFCLQCLEGLVRSAEEKSLIDVCCPQCRLPAVSTEKILECSPEKWEKHFFPKNITIEKILSNLPEDEEYCDKHADKLYKYFCEGDKHLCCSTCILELHKRCRNVGPVVEFTNNNTQYASVCKTVLADLKKALGSTHTILNQLKNNVLKLEKDKDAIFRQLQQLKESVITHIENNEQAIKEQVNEILKNKYEEISIIEDLDKKFIEYMNRLNNHGKLEPLQKLRTLTIIDRFTKEDVDELQMAQNKMRTVTMEFVLDQYKLGTIKKQLSNTVAHFLVYDRAIY
ncbi:tripartite motif-containing protein 59-like [Dreissena polymorpha]|uniref:Uncharacterized protein n=1 Tax=Dreissena polymorpha TaxID=45954 RepID=A0A9D4N2F7_DREPO|nr:tripartite motif-containing protein 59-like [Dreissena polymorpha]KAH3887855.1 hypothetical protein DPMN_011877 [Dreissena polymorpha]